MKKQYLFVLLFVIFLSACKNTESLEINPPRFLRVDEEQVTWESIDNRDNYILNINGVDHNLEDNVYDLSNLDIGSYVFKVKVVIDEKESPYSNTIEYDWVYTVPISNITIEGNTVTWNQITSDDNYHVELSGDKTDIEFDTTTPRIDFSEYEDVIFQVVINVYYGGNLISNNEFIVDFYSYTYYDETQDFLIDGVESLDTIYFGNEELSNALYTFESNSLSISKVFLIDKPVGSYQVQLMNEIPYYFMIDIIQVSKPHIVSSSEFDYTGEDIIVLFEVYEGQISWINGHQMSDFDYEIQVNQLTIFHEYIDTIIANEPDRDTLVIAYTLVNGPYTVYGAIIINLR